MPKPYSVEEVVKDLTPLQQSAIMYIQVGLRLVPIVEVKDVFEGVVLVPEQPLKVDHHD